MPSYKEHIEKYIEEAHIVINNNEDYKKAADVIIGFVKSKLMDS